MVSGYCQQQTMKKIIITGKTGVFGRPFYLKLITATGYRKVLNTKNILTSLK